MIRGRLNNLEYLDRGHLIRLHMAIQCEKLHWVSHESVCERRNPFLNQVGSFRGPPMFIIFKQLDIPFRRPGVTYVDHWVITPFFLPFYQTNILNFQWNYYWRRPLRTPLKHFMQYHYLTQCPRYRVEVCGNGEKREIILSINKCNILDLDL